jgi:hypothetical protein
VSKKNLIFYFLIPVAVQSIILIVILLLTPNYPIGTDFEKAYYPLAKSILNGEGYHIDGRFNAQYPPGYPLILIFPHILSRMLNIGILPVIRFINIILLSSSVLILFNLAKFEFGEKVALLSAYLWMIYPFDLWLLRCGYSEIPFIVFILLSLFFTIKMIRKPSKKYSFLVGLFSGISTLIRPIAMLWFLIPCLSIFFLIKIDIRKRLLLIFLIVLVFIGILLPWEIYVYKNTGDLVVVSKEGWTSIVYGITFGAGFNENIPGKLPISHDIHDFMVKTREFDLSLRPLGKMLSQPENLIPYLKSEFLKNPFLFIKLFLYKLTRAWYGTEEMWYEKYILIIQGPLFVLFMFGSIISLRYLFKKRYIFYILLSHIIYFWVMTTIALSILRIMIPAMPIVLIFVIISIIFLLNKKSLVSNEVDKGFK